MQIEFCPRCGTKRPDAFQWCRKCGLDFHRAERGEQPPGATTPPPRQVTGWVIDDRTAPPSSQWARPEAQPVEIRPTTDRKTMAQWSAHAMDVRCGGTAGGCLGMFLGFLAFAYIGAAIGGPAILLLLPIGVIVGMFVGARVALGLMSRR